MKKMIVVLTAVLLALPVVATAEFGLVGDCADCHTMHNSYQGLPVAKTGLTGTTTSTPLANLLKMDCIACHVADPNGADKIVDMGNGSAIPQVWHADATGDLAGGNFSYVDSGGNRKGHNVVDILPAETDNLGAFHSPPGKYRGSTHGSVFSSDGTAFDRLTCAGSAGCHGTRGQLLSGDTNDNGTPLDPADDFFDGVRRTGLAAISGAHHNSYDGAKDVDVTGGEYTAPQVHDPITSGPIIAGSYRFIPGLNGYGNIDSAAVRWQNAAPDSHNEYFGQDDPAELGDTCGNCHIQGAIPGNSPRLSADSILTLPGNSMSGFCATCHGAFHSIGDQDGDGAEDNVFGPADGIGNNGVSGAFLRHPSDYVIPVGGDYGLYTTYDLSAPVARPSITGLTASSDVVNPGTDMVMCLSCHKAHASEYDSMLNFDYASLTSQMNAGAHADVATSQAIGGCLACHASKGVLPENR